MRADERSQKMGGPWLIGPVSAIVFWGIIYSVVPASWLADGRQILHSLSPWLEISMVAAIILMVMVLNTVGPNHFGGELK